MENNFYIFTINVYNLKRKQSIVLHYNKTILCNRINKLQHYLYIAFIGSILAALNAGIIPKTIPTTIEVTVETKKILKVKTGLNTVMKRPIIFDRPKPNKIPRSPPIVVIIIASTKN